MKRRSNMNNNTENLAPKGGINPQGIQKKVPVAVSGIRPASAGMGTVHFVLLGVWLAAWALMVACEKVQGPPRETRPVDLVRVLLTALAKYRDAYPSQGYPETLAALGPGPRGSRSNAKAADLIDAELAGGVKGSYRFLYIPGPPDPNGVVNSFAITARPLQYEGPGTPSFTATEAGIIRQTRDDRAATDVDPPLQ